MSFEVTKCGFQLFTENLPVVSWQGVGNSPHKLQHVGEFLVVGKFSSKIPNLGLKIPYFGEFKGNIELLSTHNLLHRKFAAVGKVQYFLPPTFVRHEAAAALDNIADFTAVGLGPDLPELKSTMALRQLYSAESTCRALSFSTCSWKMRMWSMNATTRSAAIGLAWSPAAASSGATWSGIEHCAAFSMNSSLHDRRSNPTWSVTCRQRVENPSFTTNGSRRKTTKS